MAKEALTPRVDRLETQVAGLDVRTDEQEKRLDNLSQWKNGNGAQGAESRLHQLETAHREGRCPAAIQVRDHLQEHREMKESTNSFRRWIIPLIIMSMLQTIGLIVTVIGLVK